MQAPAELVAFAPALASQFSPCRFSPKPYLASQGKEFTTLKDRHDQS
jgi:hypothetical protein